MYLLLFVMLVYFILALRGQFFTAKLGVAGNPNFNALLSTSLAAYRDKFVDNVSKSFLLMYWLTKMGAKKTQDGGESIIIQLMYGKNSTVRSYDGYEVLDTTPQEGLTAIKIPWKQVSGSVSISRKEKRQNSGKTRLINLVGSKVKQTEITMRDELNRMFYADGTGNDSKDIFGLNLIVENGSAWGSFGGIDRSDAQNAWWRNQYLLASTLTGNASFANSGLINMRRMYSNTSRGNEHCDLILTDSPTYESFEGSQVANQRFVDDRMADSHFEVIKFKGALVGWDEQIGSGIMFFLNSNYLEYIVDSETDLISTEFVRPTDQDAETAQILHMANLGASNCSLQGRIDGITNP